MSGQKARKFLRSHVLGLVAIFIALTGTAIAGQSTGGDRPNASASVVTDTKFKKLKQRVARLEGKTTPTSLPPSGPAGGDLIGNYPNPLIEPNAVASVEVANESLISEDLSSSSVGTSELLNITERPGNTATMNAGTGTSSTANCNAGEQPITWSSNYDLAGLVMINDVDFNPATQGSVTVTGFNDSATPRQFTARIYCLAPGGP